MKTANILVSVSAGGEITYWHAASSKSIITIQNPDNTDLYALDFSKIGDMLAVGGKDYKVKLYDDSTKSLISELEAAGPTNPGHSNRVFSVKFSEDPNLLVSGGWDNVVFIWDIRVSHSIGFIYGPHICGDAIDIKGDVLLTGSYGDKNVLQLWSISKRQLIETIPWNKYLEDQGDKGYLYTALFDKEDKPLYIAAGGAGRNEMHIYKNTVGYDMLGKVTFGKTVTSIDFANGKNLIAIGCGDGMTYTFNYEVVKKDK